MADTTLNPNSDPALSYQGPVIPAAISSGNLTINITEEITKVENFNTNIEYNNVAGGSNGTVQFNINGNLTGESGLTYNYQVQTLTVANTVVAGKILANASGLYSIPAANITGIVANANNASYAANVTGSNQPYITSIGTLTDLAITGNTVTGALLTNQLQYANGEPWIFDLGTANTGFDGDYIYNNSNNTMVLSPSYNQDANATITIPNDVDAGSTPLSIVNNDSVGVVKVTANSNDWTFDDSGDLTVPGDIVGQNGNDLNVTVYNPTLGGVNISLRNRDVSSNDRTTQFDIAPNNITLTTDFSNSQHQLILDDTGNLTLPNTNPTIIGGGNAGIDGSGIISLIPDAALAAGDQYLIVDPTGPNHIHLRAGGTGDASGADLFIGAEDTCVEVSDSTGGVTIRTKDGLGNTFNAVFANTGLVTLPKNLSVVGNTSGGNLSLSGTITSNVVNASNASVTGNILAGNISVSGNVTAGFLYGDASNVTNVPSQTANFVFTNSTISVSDKGNAITITGATTNAGNMNAQPITLQGTAGFDTGDGSNLSIIAGDTGANAGGVGGFVFVNAGYGYSTNDGGAISVIAGNADTSGNGGLLTLSAGTSSTGDGGGVDIMSGSGDTGGNISIVAETGTTTNGVLTLTAGSTDWTINGDGQFEVPEKLMQTANGYLTIVSYGSGSHGGPELSWTDTDDIANDYSDVNTVRNSVYLSDNEFYVGFNENGNATPTFTGAFTIDAGNGLTSVPAAMTVVGNITGGANLNIGTITVGSGNITGANVISANTFSGNIGGGSNVNANIVTANYFSGDGSNITGITVSTIGNITGTGANLSVNDALNLVIIGGSGNTVTAMSDASTFMMYNSNIANVGAVTDQYYGFKANTQGALVYVNDGANSNVYQWTYNVNGSLALATPGLITNGNSNILITGNGNIAFSSFGVSNVVIITDTGANIDGYANIVDDVAVGGNVSVTGNVTGANILTTGQISTSANVVANNVNVGNIISAGGNVTGANILTGGLISAGSNVTGANILTGGLVSATGNGTFGNVNTGIISASGNVTGANFIGALASGNSNVTITANGNITLTATSNSTVVITDLGANVTGYANITGNANIGNIGTGGIVSATGNITGAKVSATQAMQLPVYADATARNTAIPTPAEGMVVWNTAGGNVQVYTGSVWANLTPT